ncbi:MAG: hypothetical protein AAB480_03540 [Patescibacteria group bacterium]
MNRLKRIGYACGAFFSTGMLAGCVIGFVLGVQSMYWRYDEELGGYKYAVTYASACYNGMVMAKHLKADQAPPITYRAIFDPSVRW